VHGGALPLGAGVGNYRLFVIAVVLALSTTQPIQIDDPAGLTDYVVAEYGAQVVSKVTPTGARTLIHSFADNTWPRNVVIDHDGACVVTELLSDVLSRVTFGGDRAVLYRFSRGSLPDGVAVDSEGNYIVTESGVNVLSKITQSGTRIPIYLFGLGGDAQRPACETAGSIWKADSAQLELSGRAGLNLIPYRIMESSS
jgi:streptogramin lyase